MTENDWVKSLETKFFINQEPDDKQILKLSRLPLLSNDESIKKIFDEFSIAPNGIKFLTNKDGVKSGECCIAFISQYEAFKALSKLNSDIIVIHNFQVSLEQSNLSEFEDFASSSIYYDIKKYLNKITSPDKVSKSILVYNLPLNITKQEIKSSLCMFMLNNSNIIFDSSLSSNYGYVILELLTENDANAVKDYVLNNDLIIRGKKRKAKVDSLLNIINGGKVVS